MKATQEQIIAALKAAGLPTFEFVDTAEEAEFDEAAFLAAIDESREEIIAPRLTEKLTTQIKTQIAGKAGAGLRQTLHKITGMPRKDLDAITDDSDAIKAALEHKHGDGDDNAEAIRKLTESHEAAMEELRNDYEGQLSEIRSKYEMRDILSAISSRLKEAPLNPKADRDALAEDFGQYLRNKYTIKPGKNGVDFFEKENPAMPALANNKRVELMSEAQDYFSKRGLWETSTKNDPPKAAPVAAPTGGVAKNANDDNPIMSGIEKWLAEQGEN